TLTGDLGAGKTTFARAFIRALVGDVTVQSPTFMLVLPYNYQRQGMAATLHHFDLYRLKHIEELIEIGFDEALQHGLCLIEWPEIATPWLPPSRLEVVIRQAGEDGREIELNAKGDWQNM